MFKNEFKVILMVSYILLSCRVQAVQRIIMFYGMKTTSQQMVFNLWQTISVIHMPGVHAPYLLVSLF